MKKNKAVLLIMLLVALTGIAAIIHFTTREKVADGEVQLIYGDTTCFLKHRDLELEQVSGIRINGKGEEKKVEAPGVLLKNILVEKDIQEYSHVLVVSDDSYSAKMSMEEVNEEGKVYLLLQEEQLRLVVFGDANSKRSVSNVKQIIVE